MKSKKDSKKVFKRSDIEKNDIDSQKAKSVKKDKGSKRRLSIYDDFEDESFDDNYDLSKIDDYDED
ncbi:hypothetical protein ACUNWD_02485 [Sunxiuqinia sp. A32]|uniref:hypothetical protein n=1 Tax=Sunxiuqinia sp. A32 TaxID=3461496 RepID=UPI004046587A